MDSHPTSCFKAPSPPNHLEPHGEPHPNVSAVPSLIFPLIMLIIRGRRTRQVGRRAVGRSGPPCAGGSFLSGEDVDLPGERGHLLRTRPRDAAPCVHVTAWPLPPSPHQTGGVRRNGRVYTSQWDPPSCPAPDGSRPGTCAHADIGNWCNFVAFVLGSKSG